MTPLRDVRDTFLHFLNDNLGSIPVHAVRSDPHNPQAEALKLNTVNIQFLNISLDSIARQQVVIDVLNDNENTAVDWVTSIWQLLRSAFYTPLYNYSTPSSPVAQRSNIMWGQKSVVFRRVASTNYTHYTCILPLDFTAII